MSRRAGALVPGPDLSKANRQNVPSVAVSPENQDWNR